MEKTMAERFVAAYREWADLSPDQHEQTGGTFTDFNEFARTKADADGWPLTYLQWWNCKPCTEQQGVVIPNTVSSFAVIEFDDGSYAMSANHQLHDGGRRWLVGTPSDGGRRAGWPLDAEGHIPEAAAAAGIRLARKIFAERGNHTEAHIRERELAVMLAAAFELGRAS